jgi:hypothetical protein
MWYIQKAVRVRETFSRVIAIEEIKAIPRVLELLVKSSISMPGVY